MYKHNRLFFYLYAFLVFLLMCVSNRTLYTNNIPDMLLLLFYLMTPICFFVIVKKNKVSSRVLRLMFYVGGVYFLLFIKHPQVSAYRAVTTLGGIFCIWSVLLLDNADKEKLLDFITNILVVITFISLSGWILHLLGYTIPVFQHVDLNDDLHNLYNHYVYYDNVNEAISIFPRYRGIFIEPGQLATPFVYLFFARGGKIRDWKNVTLLLSVIFSFSLAGYVTLLIGLILSSFLGKAKHKILNVLFTSLSIGLIVFLVKKAENSDNPMYSLIIERMEYDEELGIVGNNRTDDIFESNFSLYLKSDDIFFGIGDEISIGASSWTNHSSGIKKFFLNFGLFGVLFMVLLTMGLLKKNYCPRAVVFFLVLWAAYIARDLLQSLFWLIIAILGFYNLKNISNKENELKLDRNIEYSNKS